MPSSPPSPVPSTPWTVPTLVTAPCGVTCTIRAVSRSLTKAEPSGRNAMPHGTSSPVATTPATRARATGGALDGAGLVDPLGAAVGVAVPSLPEPPPEPEPPLEPPLQPASSTATRTSGAAVAVGSRIP